MPAEIQSREPHGHFHLILLATWGQPGFSVERAAQEVRVSRPPWRLATTGCFTGGLSTPRRSTLPAP